MVTQARLKELLFYHPETGLFVRLQDRGPASKGDIAGTVIKTTPTTSYITITIDGTAYYAHRLAWLYMTGEWPKYTVDHEDGDGTNNVWTNLRHATFRQNQFNRRLGTRNKTGERGVFFIRGKWLAQVKAGKTLYRGFFDSKEDAIQAARAKRAELHGEFALD